MLKLTSHRDIFSSTNKLEEIDENHTSRILDDHISIQKAETYAKNSP